MPYIEDVLKQIDAVDIINVIREYENSNFTIDNTQNRYFKFDKSDYILPSRYIIKTTLEQRKLNNFIEQLTSNYADSILSKVFQDDNFESIDSNQENPFLPLYQEIAQYLIEFRNDHVGLIYILEDMKEQGLNVIPLKDYNSNGEIKLQDIDPFTFFSTFNRAITSKNRANILKYLKDDWELKEKIPTFAPNIPWMQNQKAWFFCYEKDRQKSEINTLWEIFVQILNHNLQEETFNRCLTQPNVSNTLSFGLFWLDSSKYITTDSSTREYLAQYISSYNGEELRDLKYEGYMNLLDKIKKEIPTKSFYEIVALKEQITNPNHTSTNDNIYKFFPNDEQEFKRLAAKNGKILVKIFDANSNIIKNIERKVNIIWQDSVRTNLATMNQIRDNYNQGYTIEATIVYKNVSPVQKSVNKILYGPPGTGKTYKLQELQKNYDEFVTVTFHQSYGYEDFVEGLKAKIDKDKNVYYEVEKGIFRNICENAEENPNQNYAIFIDEINRGNISKIFGELITLIEISKRGMTVKLPYSKKDFSVPENLSIIGTMNTADRSIAVLDTALRRRFEFEEMMPIHNHEKISIDIHGINIQELLKTINKRIEFLYDRDHTIGHAYLMNCNSFKELQSIFKNKIIPLLQEYFYDDWEKINLVLNNNGFIKNKNYKQNKLFSNCSFEEFNDDKTIYKLNDDALLIEKNYTNIYK